MRATVKEVATFFPTAIIKGFSPLLYAVNFVPSNQISYTYILFLDWVGSTSSIPSVHFISGFDRKIKFLEMLCFFRRVSYKWLSSHSEILCLL
jgi:hypothetical protein